MQTWTSRLIFQLFDYFIQERTPSSWQCSTNNPMQLLSSYEKGGREQHTMSRSDANNSHFSCLKPWFVGCYGNKPKPHVSSLRTCCWICEAAKLRWWYTLIRWMRWQNVCISATLFFFSQVVIVFFISQRGSPRLIRSRLAVLPALTLKEKGTQE